MTFYEHVLCVCQICISHEASEKKNFDVNLLSIKADQSFIITNAPSEELSFRLIRNCFLMLLNNRCF